MKHAHHSKHEHHKSAHHASHHAYMLADYKRRFWISLLVTLPVLGLSPLIQSFLGVSIEFFGSEYILFVLSAFVYFFGGWPFLQGIFDEWNKKQPGMMTLIALAVSVAFVYSSLVVFGLPGKIFFWELVTLIDVMLLGHWLEMRSVMGASHALEELAKILPSEAHLILQDGLTKDVEVEGLKEGDRVLVKPGEKIPVDGKIVKGESEINEAMITGESKLVDKKENHAVIGGSINGTGSLTVEVTKTGQDSYLSQVVDLVRKAGESKSRVQDFANRAAFWLTVIAVTAGVVTLAAWLIYGREFVFALERMVTVMVITCPHALGLAIPLVIAVITSLSAKNGLLIRNRIPFENARNINIMVFDKTGTLTKGEFGVTDVESFGEWSEQELILRAASVESQSEHSIGRGIVQEAARRNLEGHEVENFKSIPGKGASGYVDGELVYVGNKGILEAAHVDLRQEEKVNQIASQGKTIVFVVTKNNLQGIIGLADMIREESKEAIQRLKKMGLEIAMITGDNQPTAKYVAEALGITTFFSEVLPDKKSEKIETLQKRAKKVAMVGDGINDAPALAQADLGIAIGAGTDVAVETADVVLVENDPRDAVDVVSLSKITQRKMKQNLFWATGYNVIAIPLAAGALYKFGILLAPAVGAVVMSISTIAVAVNARLISYQR